jgi:hypothetical protein
VRVDYRSGGGGAQCLVGKQEVTKCGQREGKKKDKKKR